jgi:CPA1 family monovalent cation:H+ antiporter
LTGTGLILDRAKSAGRAGYLAASRELLTYRWPFRLAHVLHRRLRFHAMLAWQIAERVDALLVRRLVMEELGRFARTRLRAVFGDAIAELLESTQAIRTEEIQRALDALRLQYPDYTEALERRFLLQSGIRLLGEEYRKLREDGLIGRELFDQLVRTLDAEQRRANILPPLDLGLDPMDLARRLDLFAKLGETEIRSLVRHFTARLAVPGEVIIRKGERGNAVYLISSGAVEITLPTQKIRLGRGEFFGEMAILAHRRRQADVTALGYCQLLVLTSGDFLKFLDASPQARAQIDRVVAARAEMNRQSAAASDQAN